MAQYIKQGNIFGRIGTGIGQGLADQLPKEMERNRLSSGLEKFENDYQNLSPTQQLARLSAIPGITPQMIQSFSELARQQAKSNSFNKANGLSEGSVSASPNLMNKRFSDFIEQTNNQQQPNQYAEQNPQQRTPNVNQNDYGQDQIVNENPLDEKSLTKPPWTPAQRNDRIVQYMNQGFTADQSQSLAADDESRDLAEPGALQKRYEDLEKKRDKARNEFKRHLERKLQKTGENVFKDLDGEMISNMERGMERDLRTNPKATIEDVANDWSNRALELARTNSAFNKTASKIGLSSFLKKDTDLKKLREYADIYKKAGNSESYWNKLQSQVGLSPQSSANIAFPPSKAVKSYISSYKPPSSRVLKDSYARRAASEIEKTLTTDDSLLSIAWELRQKEPDFDQQAFFDQLSQDKDMIRLNERQRREMAEGTSDVFANWADILIFPFFKG